MESINSLDELYAITKENLEGQYGTITINFANRSHVYSGNDVIGNCLQEWLPDWFEYLGVDIQPGEFTQAFPDFVANFEDRKYDVEVKAWNFNNSPAFDIANFTSFLSETYKSPGKIDASYFILGYTPLNDGFSQGFRVEKVYLKKIWEITNASKKYPVGLQVKKQAPYAMRPTNFSRENAIHFESKSQFIIAVRNAFEMFLTRIDLPFTPDEWYEIASKY